MTPRDRSRLRRSSWVVAAIATVVTSAACQAGETRPETPGAPPATASTPTAAAPTSSTAPTPTPSAPPASAPALKRVGVGTVTDTRSASASGSGSADLRFTTKGQFAVVVRLDCSRCRGAFTLRKPDRMTPYGQGRAPIKASYLTAVFTDDDPKQAMQLTATGRWKVTFLSWNDLPVEKGRQSGRGSTVIYLGDRASRLGVTYKPAGSGDSFSGRLFTVSKQPLIFGGDEPLDETYETDLPGVIAIETKGSWTLTPRG